MPESLAGSGGQRILFFVISLWSAATCRRFRVPRSQAAIKSGDKSPHSKVLLLILVLACLQGCTSRQHSITPEGPVRRQIMDDSGKQVSLPVLPLQV